MNNFTNISLEDLIKIAREVCGPQYRQLHGKEYQDVYLLLKLCDPIEVSNNQRTITETYKIGDLEYNVHHFLHGEPIIEQLEISSK